MDRLLALAKKGLSLRDVLIIDCHAHLGPWYNFHIPWNDVPGMLKAMDYLGIDRACIAAHAAIGPDYRLGNQLVAEAVKKFPHRFVGYAVINPNYPQDIENELNTCFQELKLQAIKIHPGSHNYPADGPNYRTVYEYAGKRGCPVLSHTWEDSKICDPKLFDNLGRQYPQVNFILGHSGGGFKGYEESVGVAKKRDNIYLDLVHSYHAFGLVEKFVREVGVEKVLYGSDMPFIDAAAGLGKVIYAKISQKDKELILGLNMARLLKLM